MNDKGGSVRAPQWAQQPFHDFLSFQEQLQQVLHLSMRGISSVQGMPGVVKALAILDDAADSEDTKAHLEEAKKLAALAEREVKEGFPLLHAQACMTLWSYLENLIRTFVASWIEHVPSVLSATPLASIKVSLGEYESLAADEKALFIAELLDRTCSGVLRQGVSRFEAQLQALGLAGTTSETVRRDLFELNQVRNAIAHRCGLADRKLVDACPWLGLAV